MKKISVIVPIFKVEQYLENCINSIINQTYENLEIILVDDGSPDNCGAICDEFAVKDNRIKVIHKENGGISSARNAGLDIATGDLIAFIDSDDWIEPEMLTVLERILSENNADFSVCGMIADFGVAVIKNKSSVSNVVKVDKPEIFNLILNAPNFYGYAWNKLYRREIIGDLRFDESLMYCEDLDFCVRLAEKCNFAVFTKEKFYHYMQHSASMTGETGFTPRKLSVLKAYENILPYYEKYNPENLSIIRKNYLKIAINIKGRMLHNKVKDTEIANRIQKVINENLKLVLSDKKIKFSTKINIFISNKFPGIILYIKQKLLKLRRGKNEKNHRYNLS